MVTEATLERARGGDDRAFGELTDPYRNELQLHCYRILGSVQDAEDILQETLLAAWRGLGQYEGRASLRTWLYRIATNRCLNALRASSRRPRTPPEGPSFLTTEPTRRGEPLWLEPYPDVLVEGIPDVSAGPEARYEAKEAIALAFVTAVQLLPPRQRAVLILRDVLGFRAGDVADILESTEESVTSALKRARATLRQRLQPPAAQEPPPPPDSAVERGLVERLTQAFEASDVDGVVALLSEDVRLTMPPLPMEYHGRRSAAKFQAAMFRTGRVFRLVATRANGQPAFGVYLRDPLTGVFHATGLLVLTLAGDRICAMTRFDNSVLVPFGLPRTLPPARNS